MRSHFLKTFPWLAISFLLGPHCLPSPQQSCSEELFALPTSTLSSPAYSSVHFSLGSVSSVSLKFLLVRPPSDRHVAKPNLPSPHLISQWFQIQWTPLLEAFSSFVFHSPSIAYFPFSSVRLLEPQVTQGLGLNLLYIAPLSNFLSLSWF